MDDRIIAAVKKATCDLFSTMMATTLVPSEPTNDRTLVQEEAVISGIIGLAGGYQGNIAIHFSKASALKSISAMLGMECDDLSDDAADAIGEIANIVAGGTKTELAADGINFDLSLPTVIVGEDYSVLFDEHGGDREGVLIPFAYADERFFVEFDVREVEEG